MAKRGSIHSDQVCPICGSRFKNSLSKGLPPIPQGLAYPKGLFCPNHMQVVPTKYVVRLDDITKRFNNYEAAEDFLAGLNFERRIGNFDARDYQVKAKPLAFDRLADEWLALKTGQVRPKTLGALKNALDHAKCAFNGANIKGIKYAHIEDFLNGLKLAPKSKTNTLAIIKQFWTWVVARYDIEPMKSWPALPQPEMRFRKTVSIPDQEMILAEVKKMVGQTRPRSWLAIKWLLTYISVRPGEMITLQEGQIDRGRGLLIFPHPKERQPKMVLLLDEDREILSQMPLCFDPSTSFFCHTDGRYAGQPLGKQRLYRDWKAACARLGVDGVDLYGGTKHSTAMGLRFNGAATYEEIRKITGHTTNKAFDRYLRLEGETVKGLLARRRDLADNLLITSEGTSDSSNILKFKG